MSSLLLFHKKLSSHLISINHFPVSAPAPRQPHQTPGPEIKLLMAVIAAGPMLGMTAEASQKQDGHRPWLAPAPCRAEQTEVVIAELQV